MKRPGDCSRSAQLVAMAFWLSLVAPGWISLQAQSKCPDPPGYKPLRQDEDYSYLSDDACRKDPWDSVKHMPLGSNGDSFLTIGGESRTWYEGFRNADWGDGPQDDNGYLLQRLSVFGDYRMSPRFRFFLQLTSNIEAGRNGGPRPIVDESKLWFEQGFVDIILARRAKEAKGTEGAKETEGTEGAKGAEEKEDSLVLRLGRQALRFGSGRLVDIREGPNVHRSFDGITLRWKRKKWDVTGLAVKLVRNETGFFNSPPDSGVTFWGGYAVRPLPKTKGGNIDLYYLGLDRKHPVFDRGAGRESRHTIGARFWGYRGDWDYNSGGVIQVGSFGDVGLRAWANAHDTGYTFQSVRFRPRIGTTASVTSGDKGNPRSPLGTFNPLFPTGIYYGQGTISLNGPSNLIWIGPQLRLHITKSVRVITDINIFWRTRLTDGVYGLATDLLVTGRGNRERYVGSQPSVGVYWQVDRHLLLSAAYDHFFAGPFLRNASPRRRSVDYAAAWLTYKF